MSRKLDVELIQNLCRSNADNATVQIAQEVRDLGDRFDWTVEEMMAVGELIVRLRTEGIDAALEVVYVGMRQVLR